MPDASTRHAGCRRQGTIRAPPIVLLLLGLPRFAVSTTSGAKERAATDLPGVPGQCTLVMEVPRE